MPIFRTIIVADARELYFEFTKVVIPEGVKYFVHVYNLPGVIASFEVKEKYAGDWHIVLPAPQWILDAGPDIIRAIEDHVE